jgi:hypothetical protein
MGCRFSPSSLSLCSENGPPSPKGFGEAAFATIAACLAVAGGESRDDILTFSDEVLAQHFINLAVLDR